MWNVAYYYYRLSAAPLEGSTGRMCTEKGGVSAGKKAKHEHLSRFEQPSAIPLK